MTPRFRVEGVIGDGRATAAALGEFLAQHPGQPVEVIVNSPGGDAFEGAAMLAEIQAHGRVTAVVRGIAASAASLLIMGAGRILMHPASMLMVHDASGVTLGTATAHRESAATLDQIGGVYAAAYAKRTGASPRQVAEMMAAETWMDAETAQRLRFVDAIEDSDEPAIAARFDYGLFKNAPRRLLQLAKAEGWAAPTPAPSNMEATAMLDHETGAETPTPEAAQERPDTIAERTRAKRITDAVTAAKLSPQLAAELIAGGVPLAEATATIQRAWAASGDVDTPMVGRPTERAAVGMSWDGGAGLVRKQADALASMVAARLGLTHEPTMGRGFIAEDVERSKLLMAYSSAQARGERPWSDSEASRVWMAGSVGRSDYPLVAQGAVELVVARSLEQAPIGVREVVHVLPASDWRAKQHWSMTGASGLQKVAESGEPQHVIIDEKGEAIPAPDRLAGIFRTTEELLRNSGRTVDLELAFARAMIESANEGLRSTIGAKIAAPGNLSDGNPVFSTARGTEAADAALPGVASLSVARVALERQVDAKGTRRPVPADILLVAPEQRTAAEQLVADLAAAEVGQVNPFARRLRVVSDPALSGAGAEGAWYMLGSPGGTDGLCVIMMDDMMSPRIEARDSWPHFGMEWRIQWPMAAAWVRPSWFRTLIPQG